MPVIEYTPASVRQQTPVFARPYPRRDFGRPPSPLGRAILEEEVRVPPHGARDESAEPAPTPIPLVRPSTRSAEPRARAETPDGDNESMVRERAVVLRSTPPPAPDAPPRRAVSSAEATAKLPALAEAAPPQGPSLRAVVALGIAAGLGAAALGVALTRPRPRAPVVAPPVASPEPPPVEGAPWMPGAARLWNGRMTSDTAEWSFVMVLRQVEAGQVEGYVSWTAARAPGARPGEQVRENVEGNWDERTRTLELHGTASTNPFVLPVNAYRFTAAADGALAGTTMDTSAQLTGRIAARIRR